MIYFFHIGYQGTHFHGWQRQPKYSSIQETLETILTRMFKEKITVVGCGRTDAGVHASQYFFHIYLKEPYDFDLKFRLNKNLPSSISVYDILEFSNDHHARFDATLRTYDYFIHLYKDPFLSQFSSYYDHENLDIESMQIAANRLTGYSDFRTVCKQPDLYKHTECNVSFSQLVVDESGQRIRLTISSNRFLRGMIRLIIYFLLEIGTGKMTAQAFHELMINKADVMNKRDAFPSGLYLSKIEYPYLSLPNKSDAYNFLKKGLEIVQISKTSP